mmetsp:Transcript_100175/g.283653  ORF Transcript_100175/g.283653 Transcript_100175/m.283653 type:complete len:235 (-) Transcript_100175:64-768(-)
MHADMTAHPGAPGAASSSSSAAPIELQQRASLTDLGLTVRKTFIEGLGWERTAGRRAHSAPAVPWCRDGPAACNAGAPADVDGAAEAGRPAPPQREQGAGRLGPAGGAPRASSQRGARGSRARVTDPLDYAPFAQRVCGLVERECAFLRLRGHILYSESNMRIHGLLVVATLKFYIRGLPWLLRARWHQPLCRCVAALLHRCACPAVVQRGELYVQFRHVKVRLFRLRFFAAHF